VLFLVASALAGPSIVARGVAETWADEAIGTVYRTGAFMGGVGAVLPIKGHIGIDLDIAYRRMSPRDGSETMTLELLPVTLLAEWTFAGNGPLDAFAGLGPVMATFTERHALEAGDGDGVTRGARLGAEVRVGLRFDTGLVQPSIALNRQVVQGVDVELFGARRFQRPGIEGFDLGAWRGGIGIAARL
jgi:hypothetical protein